MHNCVWKPNSLLGEQLPRSRAHMRGIWILCVRTYLPCFPLPCALSSKERERERGREREREGGGGRKRERETEREREEEREGERGKERGEREGERERRFFFVRLVDTSPRPPLPPPPSFSSSSSFFWNLTIPRDGMPRMQKLSSVLLRIQTYQRVPFFQTEIGLVRTKLTIPASPTASELCLSDLFLSSTFNITFPNPHYRWRA